MKIVLNKCYGGFSISREAAELMAQNGCERAKRELEDSKKGWYGYGYVDGMKDGMTGHSGLCCSIPNGLKKNNPHKHLEKAEYYKKILDEWSKDEM